MSTGWACLNFCLICGIWLIYSGMLAICMSMCMLYTMCILYNIFVYAVFIIYMYTAYLHMCIVYINVCFLYLWVYCIYFSVYPCLYCIFLCIFIPSYGSFMGWIGLRAISFAWALKLQYDGYPDEEIWYPRYVFWCLSMLLNGFHMFMLTFQRPLAPFWPHVACWGIVWCWNDLKLLEAYSYFQH